MANIIKLYAAYKSGFLGNNILDTYFSFMANIISEERLSVVEDTVVASKFKERYTMELPLPFIRQALGVGVQNGSFIEDHGKYSVVVNEIAKYRFSKTDFDALWKRLIKDFSEYCQAKDIDISSPDVNAFVLDILDDADEKILSGEKVDEQAGMSPSEYGWHSFIKEQGQLQTEVYSFVAALSASNITKQALFYASETAIDYSDLHNGQWQTVSMAVPSDGEGELRIVLTGVPAGTVILIDDVRAGLVDTDAERVSDGFESIVPADAGIKVDFSTDDTDGTGASSVIDDVTKPGEEDPGGTVPVIIGVAAVIAAAGVIFAVVKGRKKK